MVLEVIATTLSEAVQASEWGADRIELVTGMAEGGLTPSLGLIDEVSKSLDIPVYVMVRPHSHSYCYDAMDIKTMLNDISRIQKTNAEGIVVGGLTPDNTIDTEVMRTLCDAADGLSVTFHRAFDEVRDQTEALHTLIDMGRIERVLTSGGKASVLDASEKIRHLLEMSQGSRLRIMAGSGLTVEGLETFIRRTGIEEVHFGRAVRINGNLNMPIDRTAMESIRRTLRNTSDAK